ncbi:MAG: peptide-methionine (S)-S-oxide reductase MsrA [Crocinitomicaceae bacterium]|nr:peptide-methionine (S)-S-oxide reductase MsrA [Crocinitomicaceae bacterium]
MKRLMFIPVIVLLFISCTAATTSEQSTTFSEPKNLEGLQTAYFASGCFWCVEAVFESVRGVEEAVSGYSGGTSVNPTYQEVGSGRSDHAEAVKVYYDSTVVSFETLVEVFFNSHDPSTLNRQGPDAGTQYRSIAFYQSTDQKEIIEKKVKELLRSEYASVTTQVIPFDVFYDAEDYHQDYERLHSNDSYVLNVSIPRLNAFKQKMPEVLK